MIRISEDTRRTWIPNDTIKLGIEGQRRVLQIFTTVAVLPKLLVSTSLATGRGDPSQTVLVPG